MAKLYAELASDKGGRVVKKGGNSFIAVELYRGNNRELRLSHGYDNRLYIDNGTIQACITIDKLELCHQPDQPNS